MIKLHLDGIPPSVNNVYTVVRGRKILTKDGRKYITETKTHLVEKFQKEMRFFKKDVPYLIVFRMYFEAVENAGWFTGKAASRYKQIDLSNRVKLLEDCLKDAAGIDDAQNLRVVLDKQQGKERTEIWVWDLENEETPFDAGFRSL